MTLTGYSQLIKQLGLLLILSLLNFSVYAVCSSYSGFATLNEVNRSGNSTRFVEIAILDTSITSSVFNNWTLNICNSSNSCSGNISLANATTTGYPWIVIDKAYISSQNYIDLSNGTDMILKDASGNTIDYLSVAGYTAHRDSSCSLTFGWAIAGSNTQTIARSPDGTGDWVIAGSGNSGPETQGGSNDLTTGGTPAPLVSVSNVTVVKGQTASFTLSISSTSSYNISVGYVTRNATAVAGTDYTAVSGTAIIPAGSTSTTINVPTNAASTSGQVYFYLYLYNEVNGSVANHFPSGTILAKPLASWSFEESSWSGTANEVVDSSGNGYNGTATNGPVTAITTPAITGSPGTCRYGSFDGNNDYIALSNFPNLTGSFTITGWIYAFRAGHDQRIFADDESNNGYAFSLGDSCIGCLRFLDRKVNSLALDSTAVINTNTWYHIAAVHDATNKTRQIFVNGVATTTAQTYTGTWGADSGIASIGGETDNAGTEATSNFRFQGYLDEIRVYNSALDAAAITAVKNDTHTCTGSGLDHIEIQHDGSALTCEPESITVRTCANVSCSLLYTGSVSVTLSPSGWVGGNTQTISGGSATLQLRNTTAQTINLAVSSSAPLASGSTVCLNTATGSSSCALTFYDTGFIYTIPTQTSCSSSSVTISAVRLDNTSQRCVPSFQNRSTNVNFWTTYISPTTGTRTLILNNETSNFNLATSSPGTSVPLSFNSNGQANVTLTYNDAGQLTLNSQFVGSGSETGLVMNGATTYVTKPYKFYVYSDDANSDCVGAGATCSVFKRAGENFNLKIRAACVDNTVTPNFQLSGVTLTHANVAPAIASGTLKVSSVDFSASDAGEHIISNEAFSEVGVFTVTAATPAGGYFSSMVGDNTVNVSANIGRFIPDHFCLSNNSLANRTDANTATSCTDNFNFLDEDLDLRYRLTAQQRGAVCSDGTLTQNYSGAWSKFNAPFTENTALPAESGKFNLAAENDPSGTATDLSGRILINTGASTPSNGLFTNGIIDISERLHVTRLGSAPNYTAEAPYLLVTFAFYPQDTDAVGIDSTDLIISSNPYRTLANTRLYFGRLFANNAYGPETLPLSMWAQTQYCNSVSSGQCASWSALSNDSCTRFSVTPPSQTSLGYTSAGDGLGYYQRATPTVSAGSYSFNASSGRLHVPDSFGHSAGWQLFYTGGGNGGDYLIPFVTHPYLRTQNGTASFGQFRGDDRIIYWRELLQ